MSALVEVLEHYGADNVPEGRNRPMRCPFHDDRHASASIDTDKGVFNCHTCGVAGDDIGLVILKEGCSYVDALAIVEDLARGGGREVRRGPRREGSALPPGSGNRHRDSRYVPPWRLRRARYGP